jgi:hypothetical protein
MLMKIVKRVVWILAVVLGICMLGGCGSADKDPQPAANEEPVAADDAGESDGDVPSGGNDGRGFEFRDTVTGKTVDWVFPNIGKDPSSWQEFAYSESGEMFWAAWDLYDGTEFSVKIAEGEYYYDYIPADRAHGVSWYGNVKEGTGGLNLRAEPSQDAEIVKVINDGEAIIGYVEGAALISLANDEEIGWVCKLRNSVTSGGHTWEYATYSDENGNNYTGWVAMEYVEASGV